MKLKSELRKLNVDGNFVKYALNSKLTWEEKVALRDAIRNIAEKEGVKKIVNRKSSVIIDFDEHPLGYTITGKAGLTFNTIMVDTDGIEHDTYRSMILFNDLVEYETFLWSGYMSNNFKQFHEKIAKFKASLRAYYYSKHEEGVKGFERRPLNF